MQNENYCEFLEERKQEQIPIVLTPAEAMDILGVGKNTMYRLLNSGKLSAVRVGRLWRIAAIAVDEFMSRNQNESAK